MCDQLTIEPAEFDESILCNRYRINGVPTTSALLRLLDDFKQQHPEHQVLLTLDDYGQACYTSFHSVMSHDLNQVEGHDLSNLPAKCFEDGEHIGYLSTQEEFFIRKANFEKLLSQTSFEDLCARGVSILNEQDVAAFDNDLAELIDGKYYLLCVATDKPYGALYAFPNGYFTCDLNPGENALLAKILDERFSYQLVGIGASYLAYRKQRELDYDERDELIALLNKVYMNDFDNDLREKLSKAIKTKPVLILKYTE